MRTFFRAGLVVLVAAAGAYSAGAWYLGGKVEVAIGEPYRHLANIPNLKLVGREYRRGVFSSEETVRFELFGNLSRFIEQTQKQKTASTSGTAPFNAFQLTIISRVRHGPLPDGRTFAAAMVDSELDVDERFRPMFAAALGERKFLTASTVYRFGGDGDSSITSPPLVLALPGALPDAIGRLSWAGIKATMHFSRDFSSYTLAGEAPKLEITGDGARLFMTGLRFDTQSTRILQEEPLLYSGKHAVSIAEAGLEDTGLANRTLLLRKLSYEVNVPVTGEFIDVVAKIGVQEVLVGESNFGPAHYDLSLKHLHGRTVAQLQRALMQVYADPTAMAQARHPGEAFAPLAKPALKLLEYNPQVSLDRVSFQSPHGEVRIAAQAKLVDAGPQDFAEPARLLARLDASADIALPENLLTGQWGISPAAAEGVQRQIEALVDQGFILREGSLIKSRLAFSGGQFTVNGKSFDPRVLQGPTVEPGQPAMRTQPGTTRPSRLP